MEESSYVSQEHIFFFFFSLSSDNGNTQHNEYAVRSICGSPYIPFVKVKLFTWSYSLCVQLFWGNV